MGHGEIMLNNCSTTFLSFLQLKSELYLFEEVIEISLSVLMVKH